MEFRPPVFLALLKGGHDPFWERHSGFGAFFKVTAITVILVIPGFVALLLFLWRARFLGGGSSELRYIIK